MHVADTGHNRVVVVEAATGTAVRVWGSPGGCAGFDNVPAGAESGGAPVCATFALPQGVAVDAITAKLYVCDMENHALRRVDLDSSAVSKLGSAGAQKDEYRAGAAGAAQRVPFRWNVAIAERRLGGGATTT